MVEVSKLMVWIVDDDASVRWVLEKALQGEGIATRSFDSAQTLLETFAVDRPDILMTDVRMPGMDASRRLPQRHWSGPIALHRRLMCYDA